ncbi:MAG: LacI family DNA-binding transcriptional regulator [Verrucomicrobia bacterium]|nr:LacI family DNA-binding transcriptional regulator [Verrucomicrobiota bacterium]
MQRNRTQRATLLDIAADAGVSRATVSLVIRDVPTVAAATRKRVLQSIKKLGYVYHRAAASLRTQQSHAIGLIVSDITNPFFAEVIVAIEERLAAAGLVTLLGNTSENGAKQERLLKTMGEFPADGILICPALDEGAPREPALNVRDLLPVVAFVRRLPGLDYAGIDNAHGAELAVEHLHDIGHRRIAFLGGNPQRSTGAERLQGYRQALARRKLRFDPLIVMPSVPNRRGGYDGVQKLLKLEHPPTAALCFNDVVAFGALEALQQSGLRPGTDFGIVGFNNIPEAAQSVPGLTTVDTALRQLGEAAAELLLKRVERRDAPKQTVILQPRLVVRGSCGASPCSKTDHN